MPASYKGVLDIDPVLDFDPIKKQPSNKNSISGNMSKVVTVVVATGMQGGSVGQAFLNSEEYSIRAITRNRQSEQVKALLAGGVEIVEADINNLESLIAAFAGSYAIYSVTNFFEAFPTVGNEKAIEIQVHQGINLAKAAIATASLQHYI
jgi:uncharacterized protein YbjT (DUF2867 family)